MTNKETNKEIFSSEITEHGSSAPITKQLEIKTSEIFADRYRIKEKLGQGGMGVVYKVDDLQLRRVVALKMLLSSNQGTNRFFREAQITAQLRHSNIITVYDVGACQDQPFFTMDFIQGVSLKKFAKNTPLSIEQIVDLMVKISEAVQYAHSEGIVHRDLKPGNIMMDTNQEPKVMDFGLAKMEQVSKELSKTGMIIGTLQYMPPEQADGKPSDIDVRSDVYSLGAIFYELLAGEPPFQGETTFNLLYQILNKNPIAPGKIKNIPKELDTICLKALEKQKQRRYQNTAEFIEDLHKFRKGEAIQVFPWHQTLKKRAIDFYHYAAVPAGYMCLLAYLTLIIMIYMFLHFYNPLPTIEKAKQFLELYFLWPTPVQYVIDKAPKTLDVARGQRVTEKQYKKLLAKLKNKKQLQGTRFSIAEELSRPVYDMVQMVYKNNLKSTPSIVICVLSLLVYMALISSVVNNSKVLNDENTFDNYRMQFWLLFFVFPLLNIFAYFVHAKIQLSIDKSITAYSFLYTAFTVLWLLTVIGIMTSVSFCILKWHQISLKNIIIGAILTATVWVMIRWGFSSYAVPSLYQNLHYFVFIPMLVIGSYFFCVAYLLGLYIIHLLENSHFFFKHT